jgi:membrane-associated phospholipid phosphatase
MTLSAAKSAQTDPPESRLPSAGSVARKSALLVVLSAALFVLLYWVAVRSGVGQRFENNVWVGSGRISTERPVQASNALSRIDLWSGGVAVVAVFLIGLLRHRIALALTGVAVVGASVVTAEMLKDRLIRPSLVPGAFNAGNSFPSGHTSVAMSLMFALILVVPYRIRGMVAFFSALLATGIGALTIVAQWHRPSDTLGADLIVLGYASLAVLLLAMVGHVSPASLRFSSSKAARSVLVVGPIVLGTIVALCGAAFFAALTYYHLVSFGPMFDTFHAAFFAGCLLALAGSGLVTLALLWLLGRLDLIPPLARRTRPAQDGK